MFARLKRRVIRFLKYANETFIGTGTATTNHKSDDFNTTFNRLKWIENSALNRVLQNHRLKVYLIHKTKLNMYSLILC